MNRRRHGVLSEPRFARAMLAMVSVFFGCEGDVGSKARSSLQAAIEETRPMAPPSMGTTPRMPWSGAEPHRFKLLSTFFLHSPTGARQGVTVNRFIDRGVEGKYRIFDERLWVHPDEAPDGEMEGREILYDGAELFIRRAWGPWMSREVLGGLESRYIAEAYEDIESMVRTFEPYMTWTALPADAGTFMGAQVAWYSVSLNPDVELPKSTPEALASMRNHELHWKKWLRLTHRPTKLEGRIAKRVDGVDGFMVGSLKVEGQVRIGDGTWGFKTELRGRLFDLPSGSFAPPQDALPARRSRPWKMIRDVLGDSLAEPYERW